VYGRWPWPRSVYAEAVDYLGRNDARAIGFDIIFSERDARNDLGAETISELVSYAKNSDIPEVREALLKKLGALGDNAGDKEFVNAARTSGMVFQPAVFYADRNDLDFNPGLGSGEKDSEAIIAAFEKSSIPFAVAIDPYFNATIPFAGLASVSRGVGHINFTPDKDGVCRKFTPLITFKSGKTAYPALPVAMAAYIKNVRPEDMRLEKNRLSIGDSIVPLLSDYTAYIPYQGGKIETDERGKAVFTSFYRRIPFEYLLASMDFEAQGLKPALRGDTFNGKIVLITSSAVGLADLRTTPFSPVTPGMEVHANIMDGILSNKSLIGPGKWPVAIYVLLLALCVAAISCYAGPFRGFLAISALMCLVFIVHWLAFGSGYVLPIVQPIFAMAGAYLGSMFLKYINEFREKRFIRTAFAHYMAPAVLDEILRSPDRLKLGGEKRRMTVLFSDIEGFSTFSETLSPEKISSILNDYLTSMAGCVIRANGSIDKFIGDAVMAFWNAPLEEKEHAALACEAALNMLKESKRLSRTDAPRLNTRVGINTGEMVVGNMGSTTIFNYTVLGSEVNTASRLEALNKDFETNIAVSETTKMAAEETRPAKFVFRHMANVVLKGMQTPLKVHELVGFRVEVDEMTVDALERFDNGFELFKAARFEEAKALFFGALSVMPDDGPSKAYARLCELYIKDPPGEGWNGVYSQKTK